MLFGQPYCSTARNNVKKSCANVNMDLEQTAILYVAPDTVKLPSRLRHSFTSRALAVALGTEIVP